MSVITVIGGSNFDLSATLSQPFVAADSNPGHVSLGYGGVARNIAHNLCLLGHEVKFVSVFGNDIFGNLMRDYCKGIGIDIGMSEMVKDERSGMYLCINNNMGEMIAAVADTHVIDRITPEFLEKRTGELNRADAIVADTNLSESTLSFLLDNSIVPLYVDTVSSTKAWRIINALRDNHLSRLHALKLNLKEALVVTGCQTVEEAARKLLELGIEHVYITMSGEGVYCARTIDTDELQEGEPEVEATVFPALPGEVVNTTGAGDAFLAGVVHAEMQGIKFPQTAQYGLMAARATLMSEQAVNPDIKNILL